MANPSPAAVAAIRARAAALSLDWAARADAEILAALQADTADNPAAQGTIPRPFSAADLIAACDAANRGNLRAPLNGGASALVMAQDRGHLAAGLDALAALGDISAADADAMKAVLDATIPDPSWPARVPQIEVEVGRPIDLLDVQASRPGA